MPSSQPDTPKPSPSEFQAAQTKADSHLELPPFQSIEVGQLLGNVRLTASLGQSRLGKVFQAREEATGLPVVVRLLKLPEADAEAIREELQYEAELLIELRHPNLVRIKQYFDHPTTPFLVLEYQNCQTLAGWLLQNGKMSPGSAARFMAGAVRGMSAAWNRGLIHGNLRPGHLFMTREGIAKIAEFGLTVLLDHCQQPSKRTPTRRIEDHSYLAPEVRENPKSRDHRSDIYSLGVIFYYLVTGTDPFQSDVHRLVVRQDGQDQVVQPDCLTAGLPAGMSAIISRMMARDPGQRPQSYDELLHDLDFLTANSTRVIRLPNLATGGTTEQENLVAQPQEESASQALQTLEEGIAQARGGNRARARELFHAVTVQAPENELAWLWCAGVADSPGDSMTYLQKVLELNPANKAAQAGMSRAAFQVGVQQAQSGHMDLARECLREVIKWDPNHEAAWLWLAANAESPADAMCHLQRVLKINPGNKRAQSGLKWYQSQLAGEPAWTCPICRQGSAQPRERCRRCGCVVSLEKPEAFFDSASAESRWIGLAITRGEQAVAEGGQFEDHYALGLALANAGRHEDALAQFRHCATACPDDDPFRSLVAGFLRQLTEHTTAQVAAGSCSSPCVLVVDDSPTARKLITLALGNQDYRLIEVQDGPAALEFLREQTPDLILLDVEMPAMDGYEVCKRVRAMPSTAKVPVVMVSVKNGFMDKMRGRLAGSTQYLTKPFQAEELVSLVDHLCCRN